MPNTPLPASSRTPSRWHDGWRLSAHYYFAVGMALVIGMLVASYMQSSAGLEAIQRTQAGLIDDMDEVARAVYARVQTS